MPELFNKRTDNPSYSRVYIGRPSPWGNPFEIGKDGTRAEVIVKYEAWLLSHPELIARAKRELAGKDLLCWCAPLPCHGDVLLRIANEPEAVEVTCQVCAGEDLECRCCGGAGVVLDTVPTESSLQGDGSK